MEEKASPWALEAAGKLIEEHVVEVENGLDLDKFKTAIAAALTSAYEEGMKSGIVVGRDEPGPQ